MIITIQIDTASAEVKNPKDLAVLEALAACISQGVTVTSSKPDKAATTAKTDKVKTETKEEVAAEKETPAKEEVAAEKETPAKSSKVTLKQLRELVSEKAANHRDAIKSKLEELGAANTSSLDAADFDDYFTFLNGLK
jgi:hypothetical protein